MAGELDEILRNAENIAQTYSGTIAFLSILVGAVYLFFGLVLTNFLIAIPGILVGGLLGYLVADVLGAIILAAILGFILVLLYRLGIWLIGAVIGGVLAFFVIAANGIDFDYIWIFYLFAAMIGGFIALGLNDLFVIVMTSATGAMLVSFGLVNFWIIANGGVGYPNGIVGFFAKIIQGIGHFGTSSALRYVAVELTMIGVLFIIGVVVQFSKFAGLSKDKDEPSLPADQEIH